MGEVVYSMYFHMYYGRVENSCPDISSCTVGVKCGISLLIMTASKSSSWNS